jgi:hypothetical protein
MNERSFWDYIGLGNDIATIVIVLLLALIIVIGIPASLSKGLELDRLSDQIDSGQRQQVYATPTLHNTVVEQPKSRGQEMREKARRGREEANRRFWAGR